MEMNKESVTQRILALAGDREGHIGLKAFLDETGIKENWLRIQPWYSGWNSLLAELGLNTKSFGVVRSSVPNIVMAVANLIVRDSLWPTQDALARERKRDDLFPSLKVIRPLRKTGELARLIVQLGSTDPNFAAAALLAAPHAAQLAQDTSVLSSERITGYVYMLRSGSHYKIGKSKDPSRRWREIRLELPEETHQVHSIPTDDPTGIEAYWHHRFKEKRVRNTEFFKLDGSDILAFKRRTYQ